MPSERVQRRIDRLLDEAEEAADRGEWDRVAAQTKMVQEADPDNADAATLLAMAERAAAEGLVSSVSDAPTTGPQATERAPTDIPTSFANGRYEVTGFLGEGGKKKVYLVHDTTLDRDVAFGLIKAEGLDEASRQRITREAQAMARLGDNPNIMPIFDLGEENGQPYMVGPLMGGGDVETLIEDAEDGRLSLEDALRITSEICRGLEFAHSKSIIHRDLKPGNVWLTEDGTARIGDFGLAISLDRSRLTQEKMMVGTVSYMPPEQATGGEITPRADLYSLGAMLYEMVAGRPPFMGDDDIAIIGQHINTPPVAPQWHRPEIPAQLDSLIMRLLSKNPAERPDSAADVLSVLEAIDATPREIQADADEAKGGSLDSMASGVFVGRQREMGHLKAAVDNAHSGRGGIVALAGEPGIGKSRLAQEVATYAALRDTQVVWGRCFEERGSPPYCPWLQSILAFAEGVDDGDLRTLLGSGAPEIAEMVPPLRERLPDLPSAPPLSPDPARFRLFGSVVAFLRRASQDRPLLIILDDLHWADEPSLLLLKYLARQIATTRIVVVVTYQDTELSLQHPLSRALSDLNKETAFQRIWVRGLTQRAVGRFIERAAGTAPPASLTSAVHSQTEGNPLFMTEVVRLLVEQGEIGPDHVADPDSWSMKIPEGVRVVVGTRLGRLPEKSGRILAIAAVIGREFDLDLLNLIAAEETDLFGDSPPEDVLSETIEGALAARILEELPGTSPRFRFAHSLIQQTLAEELSSIRRMQLHARVADATSHLFASDIDAHASEMAYHLYEAGSIGDSEKLVHYSIVAGEKVLANYAYEDALEIFQRALAIKENQPVDAETASLLFGVGQTQAALLRRADAAQSLTQSFDHFLSLGDTDSAIKVACTPVFSDETGVPDLLERALELVQPDSHEEANLLSQRGMILGNRGDYEGAIGAYGKALGIAEREGDVALEMWTLARYGHTEFYYNNVEGCIERDGQAVELSRQVGDPRVTAYAGYCLVAALQTSGNHDGAQSQCDTMLSSAEQARYRSGLLASIGFSTALSICRGDWEQARELIRRGLEIDPAASGLLAYGWFIDLNLGNAADIDASGSRMQELIEGGAAANLSTEMVIISAALLTGDHRGVNEVRQGAEAIMALDKALPIMTLEATAVLCGTAVIEGDESAVSAHYEQLARLTTLGGVIYILTQERLLGLTSTLLGTFDAAEEHFERASDFCRKAGYRPELAMTCFEYSEMLMKRQAPGDPEKATELQDEALAIAQELGMKPLLERVLAQREILKA